MIHQYQLNGYNIVLDTYSGSVHVVDDLAYQIIELYEHTSPEEILSMMLEQYKHDADITEKDIRDTLAAVEELKNTGQLFTNDPYEHLSMDLRNRTTYVKALCLNVAHTCNLSCDYCFASQFLNQEMYNVVLSLDGRKEVHDRLRTTVTGKGSYDHIVPKFQEFIRKRGDQEYYVRGTYTRNNVDFTSDIFHLVDLGFDKISMEPVICDPREPYALTEKDLPEIYNQYEILAKEMIERDEQGEGFTFYHYMLDLSDGPCIQKRITGCGSGSEYLAVTPWGELFPCHQFVGDEAYSMGNLWDGITQPELQCQFKESNCYSKPECKDCWAKLYCSGGCPANALHATGSINGIYDFSCDVFRKRVECSMMVKVDESMRALERE